VHDGVRVVWASLLEDPLQVVCGRPHLALAAADDSHDAHHTGATYFLAVAIIIVGHGCDRLKTLFTPLLAALDALLGVMDGDVGRHVIPDFANRTK
jgi:hypothetical protein